MGCKFVIEHSGDRYSKSTCFRTAFAIGVCMGRGGLRQSRHVPVQSAATAAMLGGSLIDGEHISTTMTTMLCLTTDSHPKRETLGG